MDYSIDDKINELKNEIIELKDIIVSLSMSVEYSDLHPYERQLAQSIIGGKTRSYIKILLDKCDEKLSNGEITMSRLMLDEFPLLEKISNTNISSREDVINIVSIIVSNKSTAEKLLDSYIASGYSKSLDSLK
ncbi:MAG: hypothetical protein Q4C74_05185 [Rothia sp. (in: high G+C Gram-positive bacteria)]|nr:hypothetical protein [Rothia sp. (in: high G+C Gram-positive bacteria)]